MELSSEENQLKLRVPIAEDGRLLLPISVLLILSWGVKDLFIAIVHFLPEMFTFGVGKVLDGLSNPVSFCFSFLFLWVLINLGLGKPSLRVLRLPFPYIRVCLGFMALVTSFTNFYEAFSNFGALPIFISGLVSMWCALQLFFGKTNKLIFTGVFFAVREKELAELLED